MVKQNLGSQSLKGQKFLESDYLLGQQILGFIIQNLSSKHFKGSIIFEDEEEKESQEQLKKKGGPVDENIYFC